MQQSISAASYGDRFHQSVNGTMIVIAEDNAEVGRMIRSFVEEIDSDVIEAIDGSTAVEAYERIRPDWVLRDINMRPLDGLSAMRAILEKHPDARIVVVSQHQDASITLAMGAHAFVYQEDLGSIRDLIAEEIIRKNEAASTEKRLTERAPLPRFQA